MRNISHLIGKKVRVYMIDKDNNQILTQGTLYKHNNQYLVCPQGRLLSWLLKQLVKDYAAITCTFDWQSVSVVDGSKIYLIAKKCDVD